MLTILPNAGQTLGVTRNPINANFATIDAAFAVDHVDYNDAGQGWHNKVTLPPQADQPTTIANNDLIYAMIPQDPFPLTGINEIFVLKQSAAGVVDIPFTASTLSITAAPATLSQGWTFLPSGIIIKWGSVVAVRNTTTTFDFPTGVNIPAFTAVLSMTGNQINSDSENDSNTSIIINDIGFDSFQIYPRSNALPNTGNINVSYIAIGY